MKRRCVAVALAAASLLCLGNACAQGSAKKSDAQIKKALIAESRERYRGSCPCPYDTDQRGRRCGGRSAYSRPGGASVLCYEEDVTQKMVDDYRKRNDR